MKRFVPTADALQLLFEGQLALSQVESEGVRIDKGYLESALDRTEKQIKDLEAQLRADKIYKVWQRRYGDKISFTAPEQLATMVFDHLGYKSKGKTQGGDRESAEEAAFDGIDEPFIKLYFEAQKLRKGRGTYLLGIQREMVQHADGLWYVHPHYHLNTVATFRSSSSNPNFQNLPNRNPLIAELTRRCYVSRPGQQLLELDYGQIEVRVPCFYSFDPVLMAYNRDPTKDMHRDMAMQLFFLTEKQGKAKAVRHIAKNRYVFPTFYGGYYKQSAPSMWEALSLGNVKVEGTDTTVIQHLAANGITACGPCDSTRQYEPERHTFEYHVRECEREFWGTRFQVLAQWKREWLDAYRRDGGCQFLTGFIMAGPHAKNDITNYCVQGVAFHLTLWSLIKINRILRRYKFATRVIGEVHDCINLDGPPNERDDVINLCQRVMSEDVVKHWPWVNVPLITEPEACPVDGCWFEKAALVERNGVWVPGDQKKWDKNFGEWV